MPPKPDLSLAGLGAVDWPDPLEVRQRGRETRMPRSPFANPLSTFSIYSSPAPRPTRPPWSAPAPTPTWRRL